METDPAEARNPYGLCTWQPASACNGCSLSDDLDCRFKWGDLGYFMATFMPVGIPGVIGMIRAGFGWYLLGWLGYALFFFTVWEARVLCSHCPYYAEAGAILHCHANHGTPKIWRYRPEPMSTAEKVQFLVGTAILLGFPFPFLILGGAFGMALIVAAGVVSFIWSLKRQLCSRCVNFSCPLNSVPEEIVDEYLRRNPVMREAWEKSGWVTG
ncbi:MAG TPA: hypothetical protein ENI95_12620 [Chloroflexi bacterium]|nr:hypothetical protein [Chloroflexota bacterium]